MTGECIFCHSTESLNRRRVGAGGIEIDVCERCSDVGQQARAVVDSIRPFLPHVERLVGGALKGLFKGTPKPR